MSKTVLRSKTPLRLGSIPSHAYGTAPQAVRAIPTEDDRDSLELQLVVLWQISWNADIPC